MDIIKTILRFKNLNYINKPILYLHSEYEYKPNISIFKMACIENDIFTVYFCMKKWKHIIHNNDILQGLNLAVLNDSITVFLYLLRFIPTEELKNIDKNTFIQGCKNNSECIKYLVDYVDTETFNQGFSSLCEKGFTSLIKSLINNPKYNPRYGIEENETGFKNHLILAVYMNRYDVAEILVSHGDCNTHIYNDYIYKKALMDNNYMFINFLNGGI